MNKRFLLFILSFFVLIPTYAQYVTGKVVADDDGLPLIGATVWFQENPTAKVRVGETGMYKIRQRQGTLVFHCYGFNDYKVYVKTVRTVNVRMKPSSSEMGEVVIQAKKKKYSRKNNPAVEMMQKVIAAKKHTDMRQNDYVSYDKYARTMIALNDYNADSIANDENFKKKKFKLSDYAELCPETGKMIVPISIEERNSTELYRKSGNKNKSIVHGLHSETLLDLLSAAEYFETKFKDNLKDIDIYKDEIVLLEHNFISPIGGNSAIKFYHYAIADSLNYDGEQCYKMLFSPANVQDIGFSGYLYIAKGSWRVVKAHFGVPVASNINFIRQMDVDQDFVSLPSGEQLCSKNRMMLQLKVTSYLKKLFVDYNVKYSNWSFDSIPDKQIEFMGDEKFDKNAKKQNASYWAQTRPDTLSYAQAHVSEMKKKFTDRPVVKAIIYGARIILDNYLETSTDPNKPSKVIIGPFFSMAGYDKVEGFKLRMGAQTTGAFNPHWFLSAWAKYGFKDERFKGSGTITYSFNEKEKEFFEYPQRTIQFSYANDIHGPSDKFLQFDKDNAFMSLAWNGTNLLSYYERFHFNTVYEFTNGLRLWGAYTHEWNGGAGDMYLLPTRQWTNLTTKPPYQGEEIFSEFNVGGTYQPGVKYLQTRTQRFLANREAPVYGISHTVGIKGFLGGSYTYNFTEFTLKKRWWLKSWGSIDGYACASFQWNKVPYTVLCLPRANLSYVKSDNTFSLIRSMEFINDRSFQTLWRWDLNGKLFNRIPLLKKLKWREAIGLNMMWGYLSSKNNPNLHPDDDILYHFPGEWKDGQYKQYTQIMNSWTPYVEVSVGIHNIWKFFSVDYFHRLTYIQDDTQTWGLRFAFQASF